MTDLNGRPTAAELVAAVAEFLEGDVRANTTGAVNFHALVAANALRIVERELTHTSPVPDLLSYPDETALAAAIRAGMSPGARNASSSTSITGPPAGSRAA